MPKKKKETARKKSAKKTTPKRKMGPKRVPSKRTTAKRKPRRVKAASKRSSLARKMKFSAKRKRVTDTGVVAETVPVSSVERLQARDEESGELQGLAKAAIADSESVEELLEEGNALEAEAVQGVEDAPDADQGEVETHEVPEDDVPEEYL